MPGQAGSLSYEAIFAPETFRSPVLVFVRFTAIARLVDGWAQNGLQGYLFQKGFPVEGPSFPSLSLDGSTRLSAFSVKGGLIDAEKVIFIQGARVECSRPLLGCRISKLR